MNLAGKTRIGLVLSLGVLAGLGLIVLPGIVAVPSHYAPSTSGISNSTSAANPGPRTTPVSNNSSGTVFILHVNSTTTQISGAVSILAANSTTVTILLVNSNTSQAHANPTRLVQSAGDSRITLGSLSWLFVMIVVPAVAISLFVSFAVSRWGRRSRESSVDFDEILETRSDE